MEIDSFKLIFKKSGYFLQRQTDMKETARGIKIFLKNAEMKKINKQPVSAVLSHIIGFLLFMAISSYIPPFPSFAFLYVFSRILTIAAGIMVISKIVSFRNNYIAITFDNIVVGVSSHMIIMFTMDRIKAIDIEIDDIGLFTNKTIGKITIELLDDNGVSTTKHEFENMVSPRKLRVLYHQYISQQRLKEMVKRAYERAVENNGNDS